jgi:hypothetical protein
VPAFNFIVLQTSHIIGEANAALVRLICRHRPPTNGVLFTHPTGQLASGRQPFHYKIVEELSVIRPESRPSDEITFY